MTARTIAKRYAHALLDVALAEADPVVVEQQLTAVAGVFTDHANLWKVMTDPSVPAPKKRAVVDGLLPQLEVSPVVAKTLEMLAGRDHMSLLPDVAEAYRARLLQYQHVVQANVTTAVPLPADRVKRLEQDLAGVTGRTVLMTAATDPSIVGGVVTQIGSTVYDGSIKRQLEKIREKLVGSSQ
jgi:F-type H+-transporting ATPase subunit delta